MRFFTLIGLVLASAGPLAVRAGENVGVVTHVKVVSDKVPDVSSLEAWKKSVIKEGMTDEQKALAIWRTVSSFQHQDSGVMEYLHNEDMLTDVMKVINVYGHSYCGMAAAHVITLARYLGLEARGWTINAHVVAEVKWDNEWHLLDSSLLCYFPKADKKLASIAEITAAVKEWYAKNPTLWDGKHGHDKQLREFQAADGWKGWNKGPELLNNCPSYDPTGWFPARTHGWYSTMQEYDGTAGKQAQFIYEMGFSQGYQVNVQLRKGEKLVRNWSNKGLFIDNQPGCLNMKVGEGHLAYSKTLFGDLAPGRIGNGTHEYNVPLASGAFRQGALLLENLASTAQDQATPALHVQDAAKDGVLIIRMPSSYVFLTGTLAAKSVVGNGGEITVQFSDCNGLSWKDVAKFTDSGDKTLDLKPFCHRRYDYQVKFTFKGKGTGLDSLKLSHDIQHSQRPLPALDQGENKIAFSTGTESTIAVEGSRNDTAKGKQVMLTDFKPVAENINLNGPAGLQAPRGMLTIPVETPGDVTRVRFGLSGRVHDAKDLWHLQVSFDGQDFKTLDTLKGPARFASKWVTCSEVPPNTRKVLVRYAGEKVAGTMIFNSRVDVDYKEPNAGALPVKVTYAWSENGQAKQDVRTISKSEDNYVIKCEAKPVMKSITLEVE